MNPQEPQQPPVSTDSQQSPTGTEPQKDSTRRDFLLQLGVVINTIAGLMIGLPIVGFLFSTLIKHTPRVWISLGPVSQFPEGVTRLTSYKSPYSRLADGPTAIITCWVRRTSGDKFTIFAANCTHLGCPVRWFEQSQLFLCPCHGGAFYADGEHAAGPPPRSLYQYAYKVQNGELIIKGGVLPTLANPGYPG
jgi:menaquinol-cytochrome c reductase iron-sulfur subunit